jgi:hypothetical protein
MRKKKVLWRTHEILYFNLCGEKFLGLLTISLAIIAFGGVAGAAAGKLSQLCAPFGLNIVSFTKR